MRYDPRPLDQLLIFYFVLSTATVNLCLLFSRCFRSQKTMSLCIIIFIILPGINFSAGMLSFQWFLGLFCMINPSMAMTINNFDPDDNIDEVNFYREVVIVFIQGLIYLGLYLLIEKIAEIRSREKKMSQTRHSFEDMLLQDDTFSENSFPKNLHRFEQQMMNSNQKVAIEAKDLKKIYKGSKIPALNNISLNIFQKEIFCIIGHNGAGKSTLLNILSGLINQTEGDFHYNSSHSSSKFYSMGFCSQDNISLPDNTIHENLMFWARIKDVPGNIIQSEVNAVLQKFGLFALRNALASTLSIEERKKLSVAISILNHPQIVLMDEPTSGLDAASREIFRNIIREMKRDQKTVIFTTQFLDDAEHFVDRLAILSEGEIIELDTPQEIKQKYGTGYTLTISNHSNIKEIDEIFQSVIPTSELISDTQLNMLRYAISSDEQNKLSRLFQKLETIPNLQLNLQRTNIEEAFKRFQNNPTHQRIPSQLSESFFQTRYKPGFLLQLQSVVLYRYYRFIQNKREIIIAVVLPLLQITMVIKFHSTFRESVIMHEMMFAINACLRLYMILISVEWIVKDREKSKILQKAMSLKALPYWFGNLLTDFIMLLPLALASIVCEIIT